jgi:DNA-binding protein WhiA
MNDDILKRANMKANALFKFDNVNIMRSVDAAVRLTKAINAIISAGDFEELPLPLRETAHIRIENPSESLDALTELHGGGVSRSTVNRRLQKIIEWARKKDILVKG